MIDAVSYFTNGLCLPNKHLDAISYFTNGLVVPSAGLGPGLSDTDWFGTRRARDGFVKQARQEAELLQVLMMMVTQIEEDT